MKHQGKVCGVLDHLDEMVYVWDHDYAQAYLYALVLVCQNDEALGS